MGNIGVGGNGKTPVVVFLAERLKAEGVKVGVMSRGYGGKAPHYPYELSEGSTADEAGDEPILIYQRCNVPVVVGADRVAVANKLVALGCQIIISDDGLQHYRLKRDYEIIVIDGNRVFGNGLLIPAGPLRETTQRLNHVNQLIINGELKTQLDSITATNNMQLQAKYVVNLKTKEKMQINEFIADNDDVSAVAGIGDPTRFFNTLEGLGFNVKKSQGFVDHQQYNEAMFNAIDNGSSALIMTEKDAVKCGVFAKSHWWYLPVEATFSSENEQNILTEIRQLITR